jgi:hypothetical protein
MRIEAGIVATLPPKPEHFAETGRWNRGGSS